tara:strand:+ start:709 stop:975 length:267 start_codon:yes stop_codon:yes gene_type:complete
MAPRRTKNPGKTTQFYRKNRKAYLKKLAKQTRENSKPANKAYRRKLAMKRREAGLMGKGGKDMCHQANGKIKPCNAKKNRAKGGGQKR